MSRTPAPVRPVASCRHCGKTVSARRVRRGLCRSCYAVPALFRQYRPTGTLAGLDSSPRHRDHDGPAPPPCPTIAEPGTDAKVRVLADRYRRRQALFSAADPTLPVHVPDPGKDWDALNIWRLMARADPSIEPALRDAVLELNDLRRRLQLLPRELAEAAG